MRRSIPPSTKKVKFAIDIEQPGSPTAADQHPSMLLDDDTLTLLFGDYKANGIQFVAFKAVNPDTGLPAEYKELSKSSAGPRWKGEHCYEIGRLAQGYQDVKGTNTMHFIPVHKIPPGRKPTYYRPVCADRPNKENPIRVRGTVGGNLIDYPDEVSTKTASLVTAKIIFNSTISTPDAKFMVADIKDFYLNNPMQRYEYMRIPLALIPQAIIDQYDLMSIAHKGHVCVEITKGMYGLPQAGRIANDALVLHLAQDGYHQSAQIQGLFKHETRPVSFCLVVDDFGIKYVGKENAEHLLQTLRKKYTITMDWEGKQFCGINLTWDYKNRTIDMDMPKYVDNALQRFEHELKAAEHSPHHWIAPHYGKATQLTSLPTSLRHSHRPTSNWCNK